MQINILLPNYEEPNSTYETIKNYLKELETEIKKARELVESAEKNGTEMGEYSFVDFSHPVLNSSLRSDAVEITNESPDAAKERLINFEENYYSELRVIELQINLQ